MVDKHFYFVILILSLAAIVNSQTTEKPIDQIEREIYSKHFNKLLSDYQSDTNINVNYYKLNLSITYNPNFLNGEVTINSLSLLNNLDSVFYDFSNNMTVDSVVYKNALIQFSHSQNKITVPLSTAHNLNELISVKIFYHGIPVPTGFGSFIFGTHNNGNDPAIWTLSEPYGAIDWFPCKNVPSDKADSSDVWIKCTNLLTPVSNGSLKEIQNNGDGTHTYKWHNQYSIANYLISLAITNYSQYNFYFKYSANDSMPVTNYIYPEDLDVLKPLLDKTNVMLQIFSEKFGLYPFIDEKYGHAQFGGGGAMEHQSISSMGVFGENIMAHELTHQWFGDKITCRDWENIWLNEGFATYGEAIYNESVYGKNAYRDFIIIRMANAKTATGSIYVQDVNSINQIFSGNRSYAKGCVVIHMLRGITGDSIFFEILKRYSTDTAVAYKTATTEDFQRVAENVSGLNLNYFFQEWIYGENYPKYSVSWTTDTLNNNQYRVSISVIQNVNTNPTFFTMPVQIKILTLTGDTIFNVLNNSISQTFDFVVNSQPVDFKIDPDNKILKDVTGENIVPVDFSLAQNFPNPFNPKTTISYQLGKPSNVKITVFDILGKEISILENEIQREGNYSIEFLNNNLPSGIYFYTLEAKDFEDINVLFKETKKMVLIR